MTDARYQQHDSFCPWHVDQADTACRCSASRTQRVQAACDAAYGYDPVAASNAVDHFAGPPVIRAKQSRIDSVMEATTNTAVGYVVTLLASPVIYHAVGVQMSFAQVNGAVLLFTVVSVARQYTLRRLFDGRTVWRALKEKFS